MYFKRIDCLCMILVTLQQFGGKTPALAQEKNKLDSRYQEAMPGIKHGYLFPLIIEKVVPSNARAVAYPINDHAEASSPFELSTDPNAPTPVQPGRYRVVFSADGYVSEPHIVTVSPGLTMPLRVELKKKPKSMLGKCSIPNIK
jgi:hypothetical protein